MADRSPFLRRKKNPKLPGYSTFDSRISKDSGISSNIEETASTKRGLKSNTVVEDASDRVSISWENIQVFVENPRPSIIKRLCSFGKSENEVVKSKQILFNGSKWISVFGVESTQGRTTARGLASCFSYHTLLIGNGKKALWEPWLPWWCKNRELA